MGIQWILFPCPHTIHLGALVGAVSDWLPKRAWKFQLCQNFNHHLSPQFRPQNSKILYRWEVFPLKAKPMEQKFIVTPFILKECTYQNDGNKQQKNHMWAWRFGCQHTLQNSHKRTIKPAPTKFYMIVIGAYQRRHQQILQNNLRSLFKTVWAESTKLES